MSSSSVVVGAIGLVIAIVTPLVLFHTRLGRPRAIQVGNSADNHGPPRRSVSSPHEIVSRPTHDVNSIYDVLIRGARLFPSKTIMGQRRVIRTVVEKKEVVKVVNGEEKKEIKEWQFAELSAFEWITYADVLRLTSKYGSGFRHLGLKTGDKVTIFASTSRDWMLVALSCYTQSLTITTAYDTLGEEGLTFSLNEGEVTTLFTNAALIQTVNNISSKVKTLKNVIYNGELSQDVLTKVRAAHPHLRIMSLDELGTLGEQHPAEPVPPKADDISCIMYTSGSTGNPKGVMLTHSNMVAAIAGARFIVRDHLGSEEYYLAYLPLAHVLEFAVELLCLYEGHSIGYGSVRTLTDASVRNCLGDIKELRPTLMAGVPAVWESIRKGVLGKLREQSATSQKIFNYLFDLKWQCIQLGIPTFLLDRLVFDKIKSQTGGRLKFALSGGAPIPKSTQKFLSVCVCPLVSGYGMTECCAILAIQNIDQYGKLGVVGPPVPSGEIKLVDVPDTNYSSKNRPFPQGEVWLRGPTVMKGYYKQPEQTRETLTEDGWLMTGDIGEWHPDGNLAIIDRKKNLVKLSNGEYIALEKLESSYKISPFVQNICVYGDSEQSYCIAIIQPIVAEMVHYLKSKDLPIPSQEISDLASHPEMNKAIFASLRDVAKKVGLKPAEIVGAVYICGEEWTPQNGLLTAAQKLKRKEIIEKYKPEIKKMYSAA